MSALEELCEFIRFRSQFSKLFLFIFGLAVLSMSLTFLLLKLELRNSSKFVNARHLAASRRFYEESHACSAIIASNDTTTTVYRHTDGSTYPKFVPSFFNPSLNFDCLNLDGRVRRILLWNLNNFKYGVGLRQPFITNNCPVANCEITKDRSSLNTSDLIVVQLGDNTELYNFSTNKKSKFYVYVDKPVDEDRLKRLNGLFGDSLMKIYHPNFDDYAIPFKWESNAAKYIDANRPFRFKYNFAAVIIDDCKNEEIISYVKEMKKYVDVHVYGNCSTDEASKIACDWADDFKSCRVHIYKKYKFYLVHMNDYRTYGREFITQDFYDTFRYDTIPVVLNSGHFHHHRRTNSLPYDYHVPRSAYVNASEYRSAKILSSYLSFVDSNKKIKASFFKWKKHIKFVDKPRTIYCDMCIQLHLDGKL